MTRFKGYQHNIDEPFPTQSEIVGITDKAQLAAMLEAFYVRVEHIQTQLEFWESDDHQWANKTISALAFGRSAIRNTEAHLARLEGRKPPEPFSSSGTLLKQQIVKMQSEAFDRVSSCLQKQTSAACFVLVAKKLLDAEIFAAIQQEAASFQEKRVGVEVPAAMERLLKTIRRLK